MAQVATPTSPRLSTSTSILLTPEQHDWLRERAEADDRVGFGSIGAQIRELIDRERIGEGR